MTVNLSAPARSARRSRAPRDAAGIREWVRDAPGFVGNDERVAVVFSVRGELLHHRLRPRRAQVALKVERAPAPSRLGGLPSIRLQAQAHELAARSARSASSPHAVRCERKGGQAACERGPRARHVQAEACLGVLVQPAIQRRHAAHHRLTLRLHLGRAPLTPPLARPALDAFRQDPLELQPLCRILEIHTLRQRADTVTAHIVVLNVAQAESLCRYGLGVA
jgi:hypothetical protein